MLKDGLRRTYRIKPLMQGKIALPGRRVALWVLPVDTISRAAAQAWENDVF